MDISGPLPRATTENQFIVVITDRFTKLTRDILSSETAVPEIAWIFLDHWVIPYKILGFFLAESGPQIVSNCFETLCPFLGVKKTDQHRLPPLN